MGTLPPEIRVVEYHDEWIVKSRYPFAYEPHDTPQLAQLRERYRLDEVIAPGETEWDQLLLLREWVRGRWDHGWATANVHDALDILAQAEQGKHFACGYYNTTFTQCALALGFQARRIGVTKAEYAWMDPDETNLGHSIPEVWVQPLHKWVVLDPDMNVHFEHNGVPLNALEIHRLWKAGRWREVKVARGRVPFKNTRSRESGYGTLFDPRVLTDLVADFVRHNATNFFSSIRWELRNDLFSSRQTLPGLRWFDHTESPQLVYANKAILTDHWTCEENDAYWTLNQAHIDLRLTSEDLAAPRVCVTIEHSMPNIDRLLFKIGETGAWEPYREPVIWPLRRGQNVIEAKPVNQWGREGYTSRVVVRYFDPRADD